MPAPGAGIGTAGREGVGMDPLEDSPRGEFPWTAMKREGVGMDPLEDPPRGEFSWTAMMREGVGMDPLEDPPRGGFSRTAMIPKGASLHLKTFAHCTTRAEGGSEVRESGENEQGTCG